MTYSSSRRSWLLAAAALPLSLAVQARAADSASAGANANANATANANPSANPNAARFAQLEGTFGGRLGVYALDTGNGARIMYRESERFPFCSTFKVILAGAILTMSERNEGLLKRRIKYSQKEVVHYSPISEKHVADGMTIEELCRAALQYSDNTAANMLIAQAGGPSGVTSFAHSIGVDEFRLDRWETALNDAIPGDPRDTATPAAMAHALQVLTLGDALPAALRETLQTWLRGNTTGTKRIAAGVPAGWQVGDKTGTGDYGTGNDLAILWPPGRKPVILAVYHTNSDANAQPNDQVIAEAAKIVAAALG
ncbi:class A beta-lactamase [Paraburkholderia sp. DHOC27]|uniref:class A beta-lactamase n=1 Tax=Paraburkholderia sp. DHOC27 TaxID=2303330 RepID=UPI000E3E2AC1|nr:class A beta-lactamase [Paraburkholderia sp. DHOC27]RFU47678.1 class A beta-lactamase [Paraburkholderia sp. DHOC27]